jgi:hypothetical protein
MSDGVTSFAALRGYGLLGGLWWGAVFEQKTFDI